MILAGRVLLAAVSAVPGADGPLVLAGGALSAETEEVWRAALDARLPGRPVCVIPLASGEPGRSTRSARKTLRRYGGREAAVGIALSHDAPERAFDPAWVERLERCGGFWFTGGDQSRIVDVLRPGGGTSPAFEAILAVHRRGGVVAGTSAGCAMASDPMIGGGTSVEAFRGEVQLRGGIGFLRGVLVDQHHFAHGRFGRLLLALGRDGAATLGLGVDEDTAIAVRDGGVRVLGSSVVVRVERLEPGAGRARFWIVPPGTTFPLDGAPSFAALPPAEAGGDGPPPPEDPWDGSALLDWIRGFAFSTASSAVLPAPPGTLRVGKGPGFVASWSGGSRSRFGAPPPFAAGPFEVEWEEPSTP